MSENIFFNPGDSIASDFDFENAYVAAQIYHHKEEHAKAKEFSVVKRLK